MIIDQLSIVRFCQARSREYINHVVSMSMMIVANIRETETPQKVTEMYLGWLLMTPLTEIPALAGRQR